MGLDTFETQALQILSEGRLHDDTMLRLADRLSTDAIAITSLQTLADELRRDKERLDWMEQATDPHHVHVHNEWDTEDHDNPSLRQAIDRAREAEEKA